MYRLYGKPFTMSMVPEGTLDEIGVPFETVTLPMDAQRIPRISNSVLTAWFRRSSTGTSSSTRAPPSPMHLADRHKEAGLAPGCPGAGNVRGGYQWMVWLGSVVHPTVANEYHADWYTTAADGIDGVRQAAQRNADNLWRQIDAKRGRPDMAGRGTFLDGRHPSSRPGLHALGLSCHDRPRETRRVPSSGASGRVRPWRNSSSVTASSPFAPT